MRYGDRDLSDNGLIIGTTLNANSFYYEDTWNIFLESLMKAKEYSVRKRT